MLKATIGWFCSYTPTELFEAAGCAAYGIREDSGKAHEDVYLGDSICSYVRSCMGGALGGSYDFLDGVVVAHSCECMRRLYDGWLFKQNDIKPECIHLLDVPRVCNEKSIAFFSQSLRHLKDKIELRYGKITDDALRASIVRHNRTRALLSRLFELRKRDNPPVTGVEALKIIQRSTTEPRDEFNRDLESLLASWESDSRASNSARPRVMVYGGIGNPRLHEAVEDAGGIVVFEDACTGVRHFYGMADTEGDPIHALAARYLSKPPCPRMLGEHANRGLSDAVQIIKDYRIQGIVYYAVKFCTNLQMGMLQYKEMIGGHAPVKMIEGEISGEVNEREIASFIKKIGRRSAA